MTMFKQHIEDLATPVKDAAQDELRKHHLNNAWRYDPLTDRVIPHVDSRTVSPTDWLVAFLANVDGLEDLDCDGLTELQAHLATLQDSDKGKVLSKASRLRYIRYKVRQVSTHNTGE